eukprot:TRINITY_DN3573_c0_g1_i1.p1 TRINITY_DN3573_c0_g1~~TRINITY_DN3573_c0_g1_i1.p1  ORF type:complete len:173 (-),score=28.36 TRINITY_DN3573_c0_g1_i1:135-587(-)
MFGFGDDINQLDANLFIGGFRAAKEDIIEQHGITHIVNASGVQLRVPEKVKTIFINIPDFDSANIKQHFDHSIAFIDEGVSQNGKVLIHCAAGISRSSTILCAYLMKSRRMRFNEALSRVRTARSICTPNSGFQRQLLQFEAEIFATSTN